MKRYWKKKIMTMTKNKEKFKKILAGFDRTDTREAFRSVAVAKKSLTEVNEQIQLVFDSIVVLKRELIETESSFNGRLNDKLFALKSAMVEYKNASLERMGALSKEINCLKKEIQDISQRKVEIPNFEEQISRVEVALKNAVVDVKETNEKQLERTVTDSEKLINNLKEDIKKLRADTMSAISAIPSRVVGGGNMNRNILVGNNPSTLGRYTDLNILAGSNIVLSYSNNDNLKTTNLTIAASGDGGVVRSISTVNVSSVVGAVASTDYVVVAGSGIQLTMPTAVGNTNLYTIKNKSTSSVMVVGNGAETIDGDANIILAIKYVSVDLISDDANWHIT